MATEKKRILIVDDVSENIRVLGGILSPDYDVSMALNGEKALKLVESPEPPDLILLDIMMPGMDGYEVCRQLKQNPATRQIPVIFATARDEAIDEVKGLELGAVDYLTKPINPAIVEVRVKTHLRLSAALKALEKQNDILQENVRLREDIEQISRHDLKGPLTVFFNVPAILMAAKNQTPDQIELLQLLSNSAHRLLEMIHKSLDLYKMEKRTYQLTPVRVNVVKVIREVFRQFGGLATSRNLSCMIVLDQKPIAGSDVFELQGEEILFFSLFSNLIKNAIEASPKGKKVVVALSTSPQLTISVKNQGVIPEQIRGRFFERYATFGKEGGTGMGAYSARLMAKSLGGDLSFTTNEADGTTLVLTMPFLSATQKNKFR